MGAIDIALAAAQSRRRRRPDPLAAIGSAVGSGTTIGEITSPASLIGDAVSDGIHPSLTRVASPTYDPQAIAERRLSATRAPQPAQRRALDARSRRPAPAVRRTINRVAQIAESEIPGSAPYAKDIARDAVRAQRKTGVPASVLLGLTGQESAYGTNTGPSSMGAMGRAQFIPSTREDFRETFGIDPWSQRKGQDILGAALHLEEYGATPYSQDPTAALNSYSGGYGDAAYNSPVLSRAKQFARTGIDRLATGKGPGRGPRPLSVNELIHDPGITMFDGQVAPSDVGGHESHVHFASDRPRDVLTAAKIAQRLGLDVRENPLFDPVDPVHTEGSEHYQERELPERLRPLARRLGGEGDTIGDAIDVSGGSAEQLLRLDEILARRSGSFIPSPATGTVGTSGGGPVAPSSPLGVSDQALGPYADMVQRQLGALRRSPIGTRAPLPSARQSLLSPTEQDDEETTLAALLGDSFRPRRRLSP